MAGVVRAGRHSSNGFDRPMWTVARPAQRHPPSYPNKVNRLLTFPGVLRSALRVRASDINDAMMLAAAGAIAGLIDDADLSQENIIPSMFDRGVAPAVARAVSRAARTSGVARP